MDGLSVVVILWGPTVLLFLSAVACVQFNAILVAAGAFVRARGSSGLWQSVQPGLQEVVVTLEGGFKGKSVSANQLLLVAVIIAILFGAERARLRRAA